MIRPLIVILFLSNFAWGADAHCAIDTDRNGTFDSWCTEHADQDRDGFTVAEGDCDDNDRFTWPGSPLDTNGCSAGQWRQCNGDGSGNWTSCTSSGYLAEATGSGRNLFIDPVAGNDSTGDGSQGNPWASFAKIGYYASGAPAGHSNFVRGDVVYVKNGTVGTYNPNYGSIGVVSVAIRNLGASGTTPIRIRNFPGHRPTLGGKVYNEGSVYFNVEGVNVSAGASLKGIQFIEGASGANNGKILNVRVFDQDGNQDDNLAGIELHTSTGIVVQSAEVYDSYDRTNVAGLTENNSGIVMFRVGGVLLRGVQVVNANQRSNCIKLKHQDSTWGAGDPPVIDTATCYNTGVNNGAQPNYVFGFNGSAIVRESLALGHTARPNFIHQRDLGGASYFVDASTFEDNTCLNCNLAYLPSNDDSGIGNTTFRRNVITDTTGSGVIIEMLDRGSDGCFDELITGGKYTWSNNCYYTPSKAFSTNLFASTSAWQHCGIAPTTTNTRGVTYASFAAWTGAGFDSGSFNKDPDLSSQSISLDADCDEYGITASGVSPTPTPTPVAGGGFVAYLQ